MATVKVPVARATMSESPDGLVITIPAQKNWFQILFLGFWMIGWLFGEVTAVSQLIRSHSSHWAHIKGSGPIGVNLFMMIWLAGWTVGGGFALIAWLWNLVGAERVQLGPWTLTTTRQVLGIGPTRDYKLGSVSNLRINMGLSNASFRASPFQMMNGGTIAFDYGAKTFYFGVGIDEAEAQQIVERLQSRHTF